MRSGILLVMAFLLVACSADEDVAPGPTGPLVEDGAWDGGVTDVPITARLTDGVERFVVQVQVGDEPPFDALLDTGSSGLAVESGTLPDSAYESITTTKFRAVYGDSLSVQGVVALARVTIGDRTSQSGVPVMLVRSEGFEAALGCSAILGVGMDLSSLAPVVGNPIVQLPGHPSYIVEAPAEIGEPGTLRIGPTEAELASFHTLQLEQFTGVPTLPDGTPLWVDGNVPACVTVTNASAGGATPYCAPSVVDSGTPGVRLYWQPYVDQPKWLSAGTIVEVSLGASGSTLDAFSYAVASPDTVQLAGAVIPTTAALVGLPPVSSGSLFLLGTTIFAHSDVYFDQSKGLIGFLPR